jgi:hypothetical protein
MQEIYKFVDEHSKEYIQKLKEAVAIPSVSGDLAKRPQVVHMADWLESEMKALNIEYFHYFHGLLDTSLNSHLKKKRVQRHYPGKQVLQGQIRWVTYFHARE